MTTIREIFDFSRAEIFALSLLILMILIGGGVLFYENITQSLPPDLIIESIGTKSEPPLARNPAVESHVAARADEVPVPRKELHLNINTAPAESLVLLPKVGSVLADRIVAYRTKVGRLDSLEQLIAVRGIGKKSLETIRKYLYISK